MDLQPHEINLIDGYVRGELNASDRKTFNTLLDENPIFRKEYEEKHLLQQSMRLTGNTESKTFLQNREAKFAQEKETKIHHIKERQGSPILKWVSLAASLLIIAGAVSLFMNPSSNSDYTQIYADNFSAYPNDYAHVLRGESKQNDITAIFSDYSNADYKNVVDKINARLESTGNADNKLVFYKAISLMGLEEHTEAAKVFNSLKKSGFNEYENQIAWYSALNYLALQKPEKAKEDLLRILSSETGFRKNSAKELLNTLEK